MPWNGGGGFTRTDGTRTGSDLREQQRLAGIFVRSDLTDVEMNDIVGGIEKCLNLDGENSPTTDIDWGGHGITGLSGGTTAGDAVAYGQDGLLLVSTNIDANSGPLLELYRNGGAGTANDDLGELRFTGQDSADNKTTFGSIIAEIADPTDSAEESRLLFSLLVDGTLRTVFRLSAGGTFQFDSYNEDALIGPVVTLRRDSATPADGDAGGAFEFDFDNDAGTQTTFARVNAVAEDVSSGSEDGYLQFVAVRAGAEVTSLSPGIMYAPQLVAGQTAILFSGIPAGARKVTLMIRDFSTDGVEEVMVALGTSAGLATNIYNGTVCCQEATDTVDIPAAAGWRITTENVAAMNYSGIVRLTKSGVSDVWIMESRVFDNNGTLVHYGGGEAALPGALTQVQLFLDGATDTMDDGSANILVE